LRTARTQRAEEAPQFLSYGKMTIDLKTLTPTQIRGVGKPSKISSQFDTSQYFSYKPSVTSYTPYTPYKKVTSLGYVSKPPIKRSVGYVPKPIIKPINQINKAIPKRA